MISTQDLVALGGGLLKKRRVSYDKRVIHPTRDWLIGLLFFFVIVIVGGSYSGYLFVTYRNINTQEAIISGSTIKYNEPLVTRVLEQYKERKSNYDGVLSVATSLPQDEIVVASTSEEILDVETPLESTSSTTAESQVREGGE